MRLLEKERTFSHADALMDTHHPGKRPDINLIEETEEKRLEGLVQQALDSIYNSQAVETIRYGWKNKLKPLMARFRNRISSIFQKEQPLSVDATAEVVEQRVRDCVAGMSFHDFQNKQEGYITRSKQAIESLQALARDASVHAPANEDVHSQVAQQTLLISDQRETKNEETAEVSNVVPLGDREQKEQEPATSFREIILTDVHGNLKALNKFLVQEGVFDKKGALHPDIASGALKVRISVTGDLVNKKEKKHPILARIMELDALSQEHDGFELIATLGNHDLEVMAKHAKKPKRSGLTEAQYTFLRERADFMHIDESGEGPVQIYYHNPDFAIPLLERLKSLKSQGRPFNDINQVIRDEISAVKNSARKMLWFNNILFDHEDQRQRPQKYYTNRVKEEIEAGFQELFGDREVQLYAGHLPVRHHQVVEVGERLKVLCGEVGIFKTMKKKAAAGLIREQGTKGMTHLRVVSSKKGGDPMSVIKALQSANQERWEPLMGVA